VAAYEQRIGIFEKEGDSAMSSKMVVRILSISMALLFFGMVVPSLALDIVAPTSIDFGEVTKDTSSDPVELIITNPMGPINVSLAVVYDPDYADCGFSVEPDTINFATTGTANATVTYAPTGVGECKGSLRAAFSGYPPIYVGLTGIGAEPAGPSTVIIDGHDTGVENVLYEGESISKKLEKCSENPKNHGQYVRCVALMTRKMRKANVLKQEDKRAIMKAAAHANIPPIEAGLGDLEYDGKPVVEWIDECKERAENRKDYRRCVRKLMKEMKKEGVKATRHERKLMLKYAAHWKFRRHWRK
jgi:hypothetical protein